MTAKEFIIASLRTTLPRRLRRALVNVGFKLDRERFQQLATRHLFAPDMKLGLHFLASKGFKPDTILDIGAFEGNWAKMALEVWPPAKIIMVEANPEKAKLLRHDPSLKNVTVIESLLGPEDGAEVTFHVMESGSSVYEEHSPVERKQVVLKQTTLDSVTAAAGAAEFIKMDVQGYELEVLKGGARTLAAAQAVLIELSLIEINEGAPLLHDALNFMKAAGFVTYDILEFHRRPLDGAMNQIDVLFVREDSPLRADKRHWA